MLSKKISSIHKVLLKDLNRLWIKGAIYITASRWTMRGINILQRIFLARIIGAENIGRIAVVRSSMIIFQLPAGLGIFSPTNKLTAENNGKVNIQTDILSSAFWFISCVSCVVSLVAFFVVKEMPKFFIGVQDAMYIVVFLLPILSLNQIMTNFLAGQQRMKEIAINEIAQSIVGFVFALVLCYLYQFWGWVIYYVGIAIFSFIIFFNRINSNIRLRYNKNILNKLIRIGSFAFLGQSVGIILLQVDTLCINGIMKNSELTGIYNIASLSYQQLMAVVEGIIFTTFPFVARNKNDTALLLSRYKELAVKLFLVSFVTSICAWIVAPFFFPLFGPKFIASISPFRILVVGFICQVQYFLINIFLVALGRTDLTFITGLITTIVNIMLNFLLIPKWGINGAAFATVISLLINLVIREFVLQYYIFYKKSYI